MTLHRINHFALSTQPLLSFYFFTTGEVLTMESSDIGAIYVTRHGEREDFKNKQWRETAERPHDPPLSADGLTQGSYPAFLC
jgi:hypothetical protein